MRVLELRALERAAPLAEFVSLEQTLPGLRIVKDQNEVEAIRRASPEALGEVEGIGPRSAQVILEALRESQATGAGEKGDES